MSEFITVIKTIPASTWIALASLVVSFCAVWITHRKSSFDNKLVGEKKATEIRSIFFGFKRRVEEYLLQVNKWEVVCRKCPLYPEESFKFYRQCCESYKKTTDEVLRILKSPTTEKAAIMLEPLTAYGEDLCKRMETLTTHCQSYADNCKNKQQNACKI
jgi:hypothetical protein